VATPTRTDWEHLLARVLGPAAPELRCDECFDALDTFVDAELAGLAADDVVPGLREHLSGCAACREEYASLGELVGATIRVAP
jgi:predicted anti-sigma-YlaC factor YlaD